MDHNVVLRAAKETISRHGKLTVLLLFTVICSIAAGLIPPLVLERIINTLTERSDLSLLAVILYFVLLSLSGFLDAGKESLITVFGQKVTHQIRRIMCQKLKSLPADYYTKQDTGTTVSRFVGDVDTIETLFTSGIISMAADACQVFSILAIIFVKSPGLGVLMVLVLPLLYLLTRAFQKRMLAAQLDNRQAVGRANNHIPDTLRSIQTLHNLNKENYMEKRYDTFIQEGFCAVNRSSFYDAIYSPIIITVSTLLIAVMMILSARGGWFMGFFGMSVGTSVAVISYVGKIFGPLESIGMEIQNIQSAAAGIRRINAFLSEPEKEHCTEKSDRKPSDPPAIRLQNLHFGYEPDKEVLQGLTLTVNPGEHITLIGRTGAGKSTVFKLLLGLYEPWDGTVEIYGKNAGCIQEDERRMLFGYVEQAFHAVPGSILNQITLGDPSISREQVQNALRTVNLWNTIKEFPAGLDTPYQDSLFSRGQIQLLSIARAIVSDPQILLLDEITANLDTDTEQRVLEALQAASCNRTMLSISHRLYEYSGGSYITIPSSAAGE